jgi:hypothetical protein
MRAIGIRICTLDSLKKINDMNLFDLLFYTSWTYLSALILWELLIIDVPVVLSDPFKAEKAEIYYLERKGKFFYKITPIFCLMQVVAIVANFSLYYSTALLSTLSIIVLAVLLVIIQTMKNIKVVAEIKEKRNQQNFNNTEELNSIFKTHSITLIILVLMMFCFVVKF